ncbi:hypothetical protein SLEP1_g32456 [Rubroshorea leprosula]|uniref:BHLH transcription factor n=1 Tax=Rubroshorea leprosula TaxID=152421 RepID=A0AAV5KDE7_9ROSI|nr:hypothetical protein SLEP1_g32456 [Rubroshorea leprosula]
MSGEGFLWENQSWALSNSDNSGGGEGKSNERGDQPLEPAEPREEGKKRDQGGRRGGGGRNRKRSRDEGKGGGGDTDHEMHIWTERERRKKMRTMFANLHALLPRLPPKADKSTIVDEAINYIKTLEQTLQNLQKQKLERVQEAIAFNYDASPQQNRASDSREAFLADHHGPSTSSSNLHLTVPRFPVAFQTWTSSNVVVNICGNEAQISICAPKKPCLFTKICHVLEKHKIEVISAHVSSTPAGRHMYMIQARGSCGGSNHFPEAFRQMEEMFKQAAGEIMYWVDSA